MRLCSSLARAATGSLPRERGPACSSRQPRSGRASFTLSLFTTTGQSISSYQRHRPQTSTPWDHPRYQWERASSSPMPRQPSSPSPPPPPPPASFPFTFGSHDFPPASTSPPHASRTGTTSATRNAMRSLADQTSSMQDAAASSRDPASRRLRTRTSTRRGPLHRIFGPPRDSEPADNLSRRPPTASRSP